MIVLIYVSAEASQVGVSSKQKARGILVSGDLKEFIAALGSSAPVAKGKSFPGTGTAS